MSDQLDPDPDAGHVAPVRQLHRSLGVVGTAGQEVPDDGGDLRQGDHQRVAAAILARPQRQSALLSVRHVGRAKEVGGGGQQLVTVVSAAGADSQQYMVQWQCESGAVHWAGLGGSGGCDLPGADVEVINGEAGEGDVNDGFLLDLQFDGRPYWDWLIEGDGDLQSDGLAGGDHQGKGLHCQCVDGGGLGCAL